MEHSKRVHIGNVTIFKGPIHIVHTDGGHVGTLNQTTSVNDHGAKNDTTYNSSTTAASQSNPKNPNDGREEESRKKTGDNYKREEEMDEEVESNKSNFFIGTIKQAIDGRVLKIVDRRTWLAQPPLSIEELNGPVSHVIICKLFYLILFPLHFDKKTTNLKLLFFFN